MNAGMFIAEVFRRAGQWLYGAACGLSQHARRCDHLWAGAVCLRARDTLARTGCAHQRNYQLLLGFGVAIEALWKTVGDGLPDAATMRVSGMIASQANTVCFILLTRFRDWDVNLRATWTCSRNDMIGNLGVLLAAGLIMWLG